MTKKSSQSRLFQAPPDQLLLDERVSKIVLPTLNADRVQMDEKEVHWGLKSPEVEDELPTDTLQVFVGVGDGSETDWDIPDDDPFDDFDDIDDELPSPMTLTLNTNAISFEEEVTEVQVPVGVTLHPIQEVQLDEELPSADLDDEWDSINWDDVTLSDILGDETEVVEHGQPLDSFGGAFLDLGSNEDESSEEIFPVQVALEDIPDWSEDWDHDLSEEGAELNLDDDWLAQETTSQESLPKPYEQAQPADAVISNAVNTSTVTTVAIPTDQWWTSPLVIIWFVILLVSFCAALVWRIMQ